MNPQQDTQLEQAIRRHEQYAHMDPGNAALQLTLGDLYHRAGRLDEALNCYQAVLAADPASVQGRSRLAGVRLSQHRFAEAEALLRGLFEDGDRSPALLHNLGLAVYQQRRWEEAGALFEQAAQVGLNAPSNYAYLARALHHQGSMTEAIDACRRWLAVDPSLQAKSYLALLHTDDGDTRAGHELALEVLEHEPEDVDANVVAGLWAMEQQADDAARRHYQTALKHEPENGRAWLGMGLVHLYEQQYQQAIAALDESVRIHPDNAGIVCTLGWAKLVAQDHAGARDVFERAVKVDRNFSESHGGLGAALAYLGELDRANEEIRIAKRLDPTSVGADVAKTVLLSVRGDRQAAGDVFARMLERTPQEGGPTLIQHLRHYMHKHHQENEL